MVLQETAWGDIDRIQLTPDRDKLRAFVNTVKKFGVNKTRRIA